jgi:23S rRNA pseudouridine2605 synthase
MPPMRIHRALARAGIASRRRAEELVAAGRVTIDGRTAKIGEVVDPERAAITVDGEPVTTPAGDARWLVLHKPSGYLTSRRDPQGRRTVFDLVEHVPGLTYVGRLDYLTEGVLLFTTDGAAAHALTHPSREVERTYVATVRGHVRAAVTAARKGVELDDGLVHPRDVQSRPLGNRRWEFELTIAEGKTREVRRICEALGLEVERLVRTRFGPVKLGTLPAGRTRPLTARERGAIDAMAGPRPV